MDISAVSMEPNHVPAADFIVGTPWNVTCNVVWRMVGTAASTCIPSGSNKLLLNVASAAPIVPAMAVKADKQEMRTMIQLKRVYERRDRSDGARFLVERLWPRGVRKTDVSMDAWLKDVGPSTRLRKWFSHDPAKWPEFQRRYFRELGEHASAWQPILNAAESGTVTLLYSSHDTEHNNAAALKSFLNAKLAHESVTSRPR